MRLAILILAFSFLLGCESADNQRKTKIGKLNEKIMELEFEASKVRQDALNIEIEIQKYLITDSKKYTERLEESKKKEKLVQSLEQQIEALKQEREILLKDTR